MIYVIINSELLNQLGIISTLSFNHVYPLTHQGIQYIHVKWEKNGVCVAQ